MLSPMLFQAKHIWTRMIILHNWLNIYSCLFYTLLLDFIEGSTCLYVYHLFGKGLMKQVIAIKQARTINIKQNNICAMVFGLFVPKPRVFFFVPGLVPRCLFVLCDCKFLRWPNWMLIIYTGEEIVTFQTKKGFGKIYIMKICFEMVLHHWCQSHIFHL